ncbi:7,8-dihydro-8-oxoguanine triphosphatase [Sulfolobus acidocaldarius DSM 639]|uniref:7,8-dihydro-8-oxoguanine triphosphatase n=4 Tax=Sulfolobus acidocaldarius TaxID=2285 RepID=Q4JCD4_SULAC|nr:7,8-dihydro-8-oxoguanine triphosphatase [Sulfolobus acidocaldarius DSM 639]
MRFMETCLGVVKRGDFFLFIRKLRGIGTGYINSAGGKLRDTETPRECVERELYEELGIRVLSSERVGKIEFLYGQEKYLMHVYLVTEFEGIPRASEEGIPMWLKEPPYEEMWQDDKIWLPKVLAGEKVDCKFYFSSDWKEFFGGECKSLTEFT